MGNLPFFCACAAVIALSSAHPTIYRRNEDEVLSAALLATFLGNNTSFTWNYLLVHNISFNLLPLAQGKHLEVLLSRAIVTEFLVPVSSTVIPLPIYKVSTSLTKHDRVEFDGKLDTYNGPKLITVKTKKTKKDKIGASVKAITREDWEKKALVA